MNKKLAQCVLDILEEKDRLKKLTNEELVNECLLTDAADYLLIEEMMDRLYPDWYKEKHGNTEK